MAVVPFALALYLSASGWRPSGEGVNFGELLDPARPVPLVDLRAPDGSTVTLESLRGQWILLTVAPGACTVDCRQNLWKMQQVRLAQGKHMRRIERVLVLDDQARTLAAPLEREYPGTRILAAHGTGLSSLVRALADGNMAGERVFLIDPNGNLVLRYPPHAEASGMRKDLARLLRLSQIG